MPLQNLDNVRDLSSITPADIDSIGLVYAQKFTEDKVKTTQLRKTPTRQRRKPRTIFRGWRGQTSIIFRMATCFMTA